jgi:hypothetical protein
MIAQQQTYNYFYRNPELRDSIQTLEDFYYSKINENMGNLREMEERIDAHDFVAAESLRDQTITDNIIEQAYKEVLDLQLKYERGFFTQADSTDLHLWAESCFYVYGKAIPIAQSLYNLIFGTSIFFPEDCPSYLPRSVSLNEPDKEPLDVLLYPNPNRNLLYGKVNEENIHAAYCIIRSVEGKVIYSGNFHFYRGLNLENIGLVSGVYALELLFVERDERIIKKLVFVK